MKKILGTLMVALTIFLASCSGESPEAVAGKFMEALKANDTEQLTELCGDNGSTTVASIVNFINQYVTTSDLKYKVEAATIDGDKATVPVKIDTGVFGLTFTPKLKMTKGENGWKVDSFAL